MTNGEMILKLFNCEVCEPIIEDDIIHIIFADKKDSAIGLDWSWWNAEYKEPKTKKCICELNKGEEVDIGYGCWTALRMSRYNTDGEIHIVAYGDGRADYTPKYCPECGKRINENY